MAYKQLFADSQRKQALADALASQAMTPRQHPQGRIAANTGFADAVGSLGQALFSRRASKQAAQMNTQAEAERAQAQAAALSGMGTPNQNPYASAQGALDAGVDPTVVGAYMKQQQPDAGEDPTKVREYERAKADGYEGTFHQFLNEFYGREQNTPSSLQEWEAFQAMSPEEQRAYIEMKRTLPITTVGQVPNQVGPGGKLNPLSSIGNEAGAAAQIAESKEDATARTAARVKIETEVPQDIAALDEEIRKATEVLNRFKRDDFQTGPMAGLFPAVTSAGQELESYIGEDIINRISQATFGALSEGERAFLKSSGMNRSNTEAANMNILQRRLTTLQNLKRIAAERLQRAQSGHGYQTGGGFGDVPTIQVPNGAPPDDPLGLRR